MRTRFNFIIAAILLGSVTGSYAQVVEEPYEVATWKGFTEAAITYTFDDNCANQYSIAIPMFNEFGFQATFYPVINWSPVWSTFQSAADLGHEIGSHTVTHPHLGVLSATEQDSELRSSKETVNSHITGQQCLTIAYPYCEPSIDTITTKYYIAARHCQGNIESSTPSDFLNISSIICGNQGSINSRAAFKSNVLAAAAKNGWSVYLIHGIDNDGGYSPLSSAVLRESLEYLSYNTDKYWVGTFVNVVRYIRERNSASVDEIEFSEDTIRVIITDTMNNAIYNSPITVRRPIPESWSYAAATQDGIPVETTVKEIESQKYIQFNAVPDGGIVTITPAKEPPYVQVIDKPYQIGTWKGFADAAITYTFDDNCSNQYSVAIPMFNEFGFQATFYPVIDWSPNWSAFQGAADAGHEIGSHTVNHPHLDALSAEDQDTELKNSQQTINSNITGQQCLTLAYPYCVPSIDTITTKYYIAARHCQGNIETATPADFLNISSIFCGSGGDINSTDAFTDNADTAAAHNGWSVYLLHGIDGDGGASPLSSTILRESLEYLDENPDKFWVSSFINVVRYIRERNSVSLEVVDVFNDSIQLQLTDTLDDAIYNFPVTIRRRLPGGWTYAQAFQNGDSSETTIAGTSTTYAKFNAVPDGGLITLKSATATAIPDVTYKTNSDNGWVKIMPNPFNNNIDIKTSGRFCYAIYTMDGRLVESNRGVDSGSTGSALQPGIYLLSVLNDTKIYNIKILKE